MSKKIKVILIGESTVGKTSLINAYQGEKFRHETILTLDSNLITNQVIKNDIKYDIQIWDTAGQERFRSMNKLYIKGSNIVIFVYDITNKNSFLGLKNFWIEYVNKLLEDNVVYGLAGNKSDLIFDLEKDECVPTLEGSNLAQKISATFIETSAKEDAEGFIEFMNQLIDKVINSDIPLKESTIVTIKKVGNSNRAKNSKCC